LVTLSAAALEAMIVESEAFAFAEPPPATVAAFTTGETAVLATLTLTVIAG